jgi:signal transduction histidine kinase
VVEGVQLRAEAKQTAVLAERQRLARELHDSVTQALYSVTLLAEASSQAAAVGDLKVTQTSLALLSEITQQALKEMRLLVYELRPPELADQGLVAALQRRLDTVETRAGVTARLLVVGEPALAPTQEETLYRIALEALNNALKHAAAKTVIVRLEAGDAGVALRIKDDGRGFDLQAVEDSGGMGLLTMRERAEQLGALLTIRSQPGAGTTVRVNLAQ